MGHCSPTDDMAIDIQSTTRCRFVVMLIGCFSNSMLFALQLTTGQISAGTVAKAARACASPCTARCTAGFDSSSADEMHRSQSTTRCSGCGVSSAGDDGLAGVRSGWGQAGWVASWFGCNFGFDLSLQPQGPQPDGASNPARRCLMRQAEFEAPSGWVRVSHLHTPVCERGRNYEANVSNQNRTKNN